MSNKIECNKCLGVGEILPKNEHFGVKRCPKCKGRGELDWIENVIGIRAVYVTPGVYTKEVDLSVFVNPPEVIS